MSKMLKSLISCILIWSFPNLFEDSDGQSKYPYVYILRNIFIFPSIISLLKSLLFILIELWNAWFFRVYDTSPMFMLSKFGHDSRFIPSWFVRVVVMLLHIDEHEKNMIFPRRNITYRHAFATFVIPLEWDNKITARQKNIITELYLVFCYDHLFALRCSIAPSGTDKDYYLAKETVCNLLNSIPFQHHDIVKTVSKNLSVPEDEVCRWFVIVQIMMGCCECGYAYDHSFWNGSLMQAEVENALFAAHQGAHSAFLFRSKKLEMLQHYYHRDQYFGFNDYSSLQLWLNTFVRCKELSWAAAAAEFAEKGSSVKSIAARLKVNATIIEDFIRKYNDKKAIAAKSCFGFVKVRPEKDEDRRETLLLNLAIKEEMRGTRVSEMNANNYEDDKRITTAGTIEPRKGFEKRTSVK